MPAASPSAPPAAYRVFRGAPPPPPPPRRRGPAAAAAARTRGRAAEGPNEPEPGKDAADDVAPAAATRRDFVLRSVAMAVLGAEGAARAAGPSRAPGPMDARTVVNSILGAYGLPGVGAAAGLRTYGEAEDDDFVFEYPRAWVARPNRERAGVGVADYQSSRKAWVEEFPLPEGYAALADADAEARRRALAAAAVEALLRPGAPGGEVGGDSRIQLPPLRAVKILEAKTNADDAREYLFLSFPSAVTTRSGYDVRRKTFAAVVVGRAGRAWAVGASARSDELDAPTLAALRAVAASFRLR
jgi:hypothetical protein